ncbi:ATP-binding protein [Myroides sp. 1354]|uniref:HD domain-containing protein n=1 Tax=unclassified Myroides TaxID=2642485 RepID=UPI0025764E47|nr:MULTISPECIES: ATP-binding protein [unclassified Myroides]MDM1044374.1 ATP-binding protein [Myroides sp. R163-1]MDM1056249.1 ATP-binding protein [Myroides sp. 1354]MDM1069395.1 ATP-binding protein [Myroides sp. 1372]
MLDDYKDEYLLRLQKNLIYNTLKNKCQDKDTEVIALIDEAVSYAFQRTKTIIKHMGEFTLHDGDHLFRVLNLMEKLLTEPVIKKLSSPELMLLILSAFFHDIGMSPDEKDVLAWKKNWDTEPVFEDSGEEKSYNEFKRFYSARPDQNEIINRLITQGKNTEADTIKSYLVTEFIRQTHADRAREIIDRAWNGKILFRDTDLTVELAQICFSHNEDALTLLELDKNFLCGSNNFACLPLVGIILRLSDILDFDAKRTPPVLYSHLYVRHPVSINEWNKHRAVEAWEINPELIQFNAKCKHPAIEASIHAFCNMIDQELSICNNIANSLNEFNKSKNREINLKFPFKVNRDKIRTETDIRNKPKYIYRDTQFNLSKRQVIDLLMGTKLYGNPEVALRELLQNSIDACLLRQAQETKWGNPYLPEVTIKYYIEDNDIILEIEDNGTGMDQYIIDNYYSKVGSSFYKSTDFYNLKSESNADFTPTSRFGIGILSCFMVADTLIVDTKRVYAPHKSSDALNITVEGQESIFWIKEGKRETPGTTTKLILRKTQNPWERMSEEDFIQSVENVIPNPPFKINIETTSHNKIRDENSFKEFTSNSIKDNSWKQNENIRTFEILLDNKEIGIVGSATVAVLESHGKPVSRIDLNSRDVEIEGKIYTLERSIQLSENSISESSKSITINDDGEINEDSTSSKFSRSNSRLSLHGIEVPSTLFPEPWIRKDNQVKISWPFPLVLVVDILGNRDLDLNSPRTEIIMSEKWIDFEEAIAFLICNSISKSVEIEYWNELKTILVSRTTNESFLRSINKINLTNIKN